MSLNIRTNLDSIHAQNDLNSVTNRLRTSYSRLSSGLRITKASDDAAGLAIAEQLKADSRLASVAIRNANDGISIIAITDGALNEVGNILTRMAELAEQSANGVYSTDQRSALQSEFLALSSEIERIANTTTFNGKSLLTDTSPVNFQVGLDGFSNSQITYTGILGTLNALGLADTNAVLVYSLNDTTNVLAEQAARNAIEGLKGAINSLTKSRGALGASESRLNSAIVNLSVQRENIIAAESRIRDVDVAFEAAELTRLNILQQAATAMVAQANQQPALALRLLQT